MRKGRHKAFKGRHKACPYGIRVYPHTASTQNKYHQRDKNTHGDEFV